MRKNLIIMLVFCVGTAVPMYNNHQIGQYNIQQNGQRQVSVKTVPTVLFRRIIDPAINSFGPSSSLSHSNFFAQSPIQLAGQQVALGNAVSHAHLQQRPITIVNNGSMQNIHITVGNPTISLLPQEIREEYCSQDAILQQMYKAGLHHTLPENIMQETAVQIANFRKQSSMLTQQPQQNQTPSAHSVVSLAPPIAPSPVMVSNHQNHIPVDKNLMSGYQVGGSRAETPDFSGDKSIFLVTPQLIQQEKDDNSFVFVDETHNIISLQQELQKNRNQEANNNASVLPSSSQDRAALKKMSLSFILNNSANQ